MNSVRKKVEVKFVTDETVNHVIQPLFLFNNDGTVKTPKTNRDFRNETLSLKRSNQKVGSNCTTPIITTPRSKSFGQSLWSDGKSGSNCTTSTITTPRSSKPTKTLSNGGRSTVRRRLLEETAVSRDNMSSDESTFDDDDKDKTVTGLSSGSSSDDHSDSSDDKNYDTDDDDDNDDYDMEENDDDESVEKDTDTEDEDNTRNRVKHPTEFLHELKKSRLQSNKQSMEFDEECSFQSDYYFLKKSEKTRTSGNTLNRLSGPKLMPDKLKALLPECDNNHLEHKRVLSGKYGVRYCRWLFYLLEGFNLLLYGYGSKRNLLNSFHSEYLSENKVLTINGFFPGLIMKEILESFLKDILNSELNGTADLDEMIKTIRIKMEKRKKSPVFMIVHNIDGDVLRSKKNQILLAKLTSIPNVHMIASFDHINTPLLWSNNLLVMFNFLWINTTTFGTYHMETSFETSLFIQKSGSTMIMSSLVNVFSSLTSNTQRIFLLLVKGHLENKSNKKFQGVQFSDLYTKSRNSMLVTSDLALRTQLTEFVDHEIIKWRREHDVIFIPIPTPMLVQFYETYGDNDD